MGLIIGAYLIIAACLNAAHHDGIVKDSTVKDTMAFELQAAKNTVKNLEGR